MSPVKSRIKKYSKLNLEQMEKPTYVIILSLPEFVWKK